MKRDDGLVKYPRTQHLEGSRLQAGDEDLAAIPLRELRGLDLVIEEKLDGANAALSFDGEGSLLLQSRGHFLTGGTRERHFDLLKSWASVHELVLREVLGKRYIVYGEWLYAKHTIYYDALPHYFMEFDVYDRENEVFLSTPARQALLAPLPIRSVPVLRQGKIDRLEELQALVRPSRFKSRNWRESFEQAIRQGEAGRIGELQRQREETDPSELAEGLYIKHESQERVQGRYKFVRASFLDVVARAQGHWLERPIVANTLAPGVDLYSEVIEKDDP